MATPPLSPAEQKNNISPRTQHALNNSSASVNFVRLTCLLVISRFALMLTHVPHLHASGCRHSRTDIGLFNEVSDVKNLRTLRCLGLQRMTVTLTVRTPAELATALDAAQGGETILLQPGNYGSLKVQGRSFADMVTLKSAAPLGAQFTTIEIKATSNLRLDGLHVFLDANGGKGTRLIDIREGSENIVVTGSKINGRVDDVFLGYGIYAKGVQGLRISDNYVHDIGNGITVFASSQVDVSRNFVDRVGSDFLKGGGLDQFLYADNIGGGFLFPSPTAHADFLQMQGSVTNGAISGNLYLAQNNERAQGIFLGRGIHSNVVIEQNIIVSGKNNAVYVNDGTGITVRNNTLLATPNLGQKGALVIVPDGSDVQDNILTSPKGGFSGSNVITQWQNPDGVHHYSALFVNAEPGLGLTVNDLVPLNGSPADGTGAYDRLIELQQAEPYLGQQAIWGLTETLSLVPIILVTWWFSGRRRQKTGRGGASDVG